MRKRLTWLVRWHAGVTVTFRVRWCDPHLKLCHLWRPSPLAFVQLLPFTTSKHVFKIPVEKEEGRKTCLSCGDWCMDGGPWTQHTADENSFSPPVRILQEAAARTSRWLLGVNYLEAGAAQLEWNLRDLHFLRQRPQGSVFRRLGEDLDLLRLLEVIDVVFLQPPLAKTEAQQQQCQCSSDHVDGARQSHKTRRSGSSIMWSEPGGTSGAEVWLVQRFKGELQPVHVSKNNLQMSLLYSV